MWGQAGLRRHGPGPDQSSGPMQVSFHQRIPQVQSRRCHRSVSGLMTIVMISIKCQLVSVHWKCGPHHHQNTKSGNVLLLVDFKVLENHLRSSKNLNHLWQWISIINILMHLNTCIFTNINISLLLCSFNLPCITIKGYFYTRRSIHQWNFISLLFLHNPLIKCPSFYTLCLLL